MALVGAQILFYDCQTVLSLAFLIALTKVPKDIVLKWLIAKLSEMHRSSIGPSLELGVFIPE